MSRKKSVMVCFLILCAGTAAFADRIVDPLKLPASIVESVTEWFPGETITMAESDWGRYEVYLSGGAAVDFSLMRNWEEMSSVNGLPETALPDGVFEAVRNAWPEAAVMKIERQFRGYEVKLNNGMEMYFTKDGRLIGQKYDD